MSTILKALRRIEEQKARSAERPLREDVVFAPTSRRRVPTSVLVAVAAVAFAATLAGLTLLRAGRPERDAAQVESAAVPAPVSAPRAPEPAPPAEAPAVAAPAPEVVAAPLPQVSGPDRPADAAADVVVVHPNARAQSPIEVEDERDAPPPAKRNAPKRVAVAAPLRVVRTSWHPRPEKRAAWVQLSGAATVTVHEGDHVGSYVVREIEPAAVVFADGSVEIRRGVGSP